MRMRTKKWAKPELAICDYYIKEPQLLKGEWQTKFKINQPIWLELGCGKGGFLAQLTVANPDKNFIAVDLSSDMLGLARRNVASAYEKAELPLDNVFLTWQNIEHIDNILSPIDNVERIFINFCNPWFKPTQHKKRLTHPRQLVKYHELLGKGGEIWFKTDDDDLFNHSVKYFEDNNYTLKFCTLDLHQSGFEPNLKTEHEVMYANEGIKIKFLIAVVN